ncbi:MAG: hypothetical protein LJE67_14810 [Salaquimonas sp.]|jgi:hypothetical protein|nr:hypothetical protein [Salaquimonas sp.]
METGLVTALGFGVAIIALAVVVTWLVPNRGRHRDINASRTDGRAIATWVGINAARSSDAIED